MFSKVLSKILGGELLSDVSAFVAALETMFGGFRQRAEHTYELLKDPGTAFVVVAVPEPDALREASFFIARLRDDHMPLAGARGEPSTSHRRSRRWNLRSPPAPPGWKPQRIPRRRSDSGNGRNSG